MESTNQFTQPTIKKSIEDLIRSIHDYRLDNLYYDFYGDKVIIYSPFFWVYEQEFREYFYPVDESWIKTYGITNIKFQFSFMGIKFIVKDWKDRIVNEQGKVLPIWHSLYQSHYPPQREKVWLWADDGKGLSEAHFDYQIQEWVFEIEEDANYHSSRLFTHWQHKSTPKTP